MLIKIFYTLLLFVPDTSLSAQTKQSQLSFIMQTYHNYNMFDASVLGAGITKLKFLY